MSLRERASYLFFGWLGLVAVSACAEGTEPLSNASSGPGGASGGADATGGGGMGGQGLNGGGGPTGGCTDLPDNTPCGDPLEPECDQSVCAGGVCLEALLARGTACGSQADDECTAPDTCDGNGACEPHDMPVDTPCGDDLSSECDLPDSCDGEGACDPRFEPLGTACGENIVSDCTAPDTCDGQGLCDLNHTMDGTACFDCSAAPSCDVCQAGTCLSDCTGATLSTTLAGGNNFHGVMFDITAQANVVISSFSANLVTGPHTMEVYYRQGTWVGSQSSPTGWTLVGSTTVTSSGTGTATAIPLMVDVTMTPGSSYGFYVTTTGSSMPYTNGSGVGTVVASDGNISIREGRGLGYPFGGGSDNRIFNGTVHYQDCD